MICIILHSVLRSFQNYNLTTMKDESFHYQSYGGIIFIVMKAKKYIGVDGFLEVGGVHNYLVNYKYKSKNKYGFRLKAT